MILVAVDDLLFSSKIRASARQAGVELTFARTPAEIIEQARTLRPALAIFDLDSAKADPIATVAAMKRDPELAAIRTVGFVSHVHTALIDAAQAIAEAHQAAFGKTKTGIDKASPDKAGHG